MITWAASLGKGPSIMCGQRRPRSARTAWSGSPLPASTFHRILRLCKRTAKTPTRLRGCAFAVQIYHTALSHGAFVWIQYVSKRKCRRYNNNNNNNRYNNNNNIIIIISITVTIQLSLSSVSLPLILLLIQKLNYVGAWFRIYSRHMLAAIHQHHVHTCPHARLILTCIKHM